MNKFTIGDIKQFVEEPSFDEGVILSSDPSWPKVSVVTPSYNQAEFLERTILSVLNQNYPNLEYIIVDGGSTDGSVEIIRKYEKYLAYWVSEKDRGQSDAINKGFKKSTGEILAWLNSDDTYLPSVLQSAVSYFKQYPETDMLYGRCNVIDSKERVFQEAKTITFNLVDYAYGLFTIPQQSAFWKRDIFFEAGMLNVENYTCMDGELWVNFAKKKAVITYVDSFFANFRLHGSSISGSGRYNEQFERDKKRIQEDILGYSPGRLRVFMRGMTCHLKHPVQYLRYYLSVISNGRLSVK